jgi:hypothetical protein
LCNLPIFKLSGDFMLEAVEWPSYFLSASLGKDLRCEITEKSKLGINSPCRIASNEAPFHSVSRS